jgi:hypothetical protein
MFVLIDPDTPQDFKRGDIGIKYVEAPGDAVHAYYTFRKRDPATGRPTERDTLARFLATYVLDWSGVSARATDGTVVEVPWPAKGKKPAELVAGEADARARLLALLPWNVLYDLDAAVAKTYVAGAESGKG